MLPIETLNYWLAVGTVAMQIVGIGFLAVYLLKNRLPDLGDVADLVYTWALPMGLTLSIFGAAMTLVYSEIYGLTPCGWCWIQRVFLYPQVVLFALALWKRDRSIADYSIALSIFGAAAALYQHYLQMGGDSVIPCPATSQQAVDCAVRFVFEFNYITFPMMSFTLFVFLIILMLFARKK
jgi:disulfide bond formation protein DsbB